MGELLPRVEGFGDDQLANKVLVQTLISQNFLNFQVAVLNQFKFRICNTFRFFIFVSGLAALFIKRVHKIQHVKLFFGAYAVSSLRQLFQQKLAARVLQQNVTPPELIEIAELKFGIGRGGRLELLVRPKLPELALLRPQQTLGASLRVEEIEELGPVFVAVGLAQVFAAHAVLNFLDQLLAQLDHFLPVILLETGQLVQDLLDLLPVYLDQPLIVLEIRLGLLLPTPRLLVAREPRVVVELLDVALVGVEELLLVGLQLVALLADRGVLNLHVVGEVDFFYLQDLFDALEFEVEHVPLVVELLHAVDQLVEHLAGFRVFDARKYLFFGLDVYLLDLVLGAFEGAGDVDEVVGDHGDFEADLVFDDAGAGGGVLDLGGDEGEWPVEEVDERFEVG